MFDDEADTRVYLAGVSGPVGYYRPLDVMYYGAEGFESFSKEDVSLGMRKTEQESKLLVREHYKYSLKPFGPTHEFRGLYLMALSDSVNMPPGTLNHYRDEDGYEYQLPHGKVDQLPDKPKPGEVWKYTGYQVDFEERSDLPLRYVDRQGSLWKADTEIGLSRELPVGQISYDVLKNYTKVLNADGSPADV